MERRDYLMIQVEQLGAVLRRLLSLMLHLKDMGATEAIVQIDQELSENLGLDIKQLCAIADDRLVETLRQSEGFDPANLEALADLLLAMAERAETDEREALYRKSLLIYQYLETSEKTYSLERNEKIDKIKEVRQRPKR